MLEQKDIEQAKKLFREWDNKSKWNIPSSAFLQHTKKKAKETLELALYLLDKLENTEELEENDTTTVWIIAQSYYSMFFLAEHLLGLDNKKLPEGAKDSHKTIYLAFIYYYLIKGSELEQKNAKEITTSRMSRALALFKELQDETLEIQRIKKGAKDLKTQREQRHKFTYRMNRTAEISEAKNSITKATEFRHLV
jgi:coenzyme F420-reducing hydrogenase alpha subunit